ncbi:cysteine metabolism transcriptional regulator CymR [Sporolactobacillus sp. THM19-2]|jgi:Rrf2 family cysteine metabolism transcriptional repressor|uniref:cysteine metabolism transcriptional regulator CymR n=1 Tax=Sporolactobacillus sp. THM19-2 TaxID=2511171 RepID=UPI00102139F4|nr:Rrf2 family transcriptional regulator [Sporolactobacillus sp. THM19-2]RYL87508.1 Rrf2 family transcriptional regulator [Sporolactobacillus sp. THM19-2]
MLISTRGRYGLTIMMALAKNLGKGPLSLNAIAKAYNLSENYLELLVAPLRNAGLVNSVRGAYGGYILSKTPKEITAADVIRVLDGPIQPVKVAEEDELAKREMWAKIHDAVCNILERTTLDDLIHNDSGSQVQGPNMFYI